MNFASWKYRIVLILMSLTSMSVVASAQDDSNKSTTVRLITIGEAFMQSGNTEKAIGQFEDAVEAASTVEDLWLASERLATLYSKGERYNDALNTYDALLVNDEIRNRTSILARVYGEVGVIYYMTGDYVKSIKSYKEARKYLAPTDEYLPQLYCNTAKTLLEAGNIQEAKALLDTAEIVARKHNDNMSLSSVYDAESALYDKLGEYRQAFEYKTKYIHQLETIKNMRSFSLSGDNQDAGRNVEAMLKLDKQVKKLTEQLAEETALHERFSTYFNIAVAAALLLLCITVLLAVRLSKRGKRVRELAVSSEVKNRVMSFVAKDFVRPFNELVSFTDMQLQYALAQDDKEQIDYSRAIYNSSQVLYQMVGNVLAWSQLGDQLSIRPQKINLAHAMDGILSICRLMAEEKNIHISVSVDDKIEIYVDENHLSMIIRNLIINAIKYTMSGGRISVTGFVYGSKTLITIDDTGIGMSQDKVDLLLNSSTVETTLGTNNENGIGLGLVICRDLVKANKGTMNIASTLGKGTSITITFNNLD
ncbi:MAG: hypothetical protein J6Y82_01890 [Bacteroidales bacterium]|nr:hypothetical protein [Bacteroidales bacterium]